MNFTGFEYEVSALVKFTMEEAQNIMDAAASHYDAHVRQSALGGAQARVNGCIYNMYCHVQNFPEAPCRLTFRELDTMAKALEPIYGLIQLYQELRRILDSINEEFLRVSGAPK